MSKPWDDGEPVYRPLRQTSLFRLEPIHLAILQDRLADKGLKVHKRCLYRWVDSRQNSPPKLATALMLAEILEQFLDLDQLEILYRLARKEEPDVAAST